MASHEILHRVATEGRVRHLYGTGYHKKGQGTTQVRHWYDTEYTTRCNRGYYTVLHVTSSISKQSGLSPSGVPFPLGPSGRVSARKCEIGVRPGPVWGGQRGWMDVIRPLDMRERRCMTQDTTQGTTQITRYDTGYHTGYDTGYNTTCNTAHNTTCNAGCSTRYDIMLDTT